MQFRSTGLTLPLPCKYKIKIKNRAWIVKRPPISRNWIKKIGIRTIESAISTTRITNLPSTTRITTPFSFKSSFRAYKFKCNNFTMTPLKVYHRHDHGFVNIHLFLWIRLRTIKSATSNTRIIRPASFKSSYSDLTNSIAIISQRHLSTLSPYCKEYSLPKPQEHEPDPECKKINRIHVQTRLYPGVKPARVLHVVVGRKHGVAADPLASHSACRSRRHRGCHSLTGIYNESEHQAARGSEDCCFVQWSAVATAIAIAMSNLQFLVFRVRENTEP